MIVVGTAPFTHAMLLRFVVSGAGAAIGEVGGAVRGWDAGQGLGTGGVALSGQPWLIVGFLGALSANAHGFEPGSVILIEEPDVIRKREVAAFMSRSPMLRELLEWEYQRPGAAEELYALRPDLNPALVAPLVEYATPFAARIAELYGLPGAGYAAALAMRDKALLRQITRSAGIRNPESEAVETSDDVRRFMTAHPGPVVLKPADRQGALGTKILQHVSEVEGAWQECIDQDEGVLVPDREFPLRMLTERYVKGDEYSVEMLVRNGVPLLANITQKRLYPGPRPVELAHVVPADLPDDTARLLQDGTTAVLDAVGFGSGVVHCEWIVSEGRPYLIECAGRFPGDGIPEMIALSYVIDLPAHFYTVMRGLEPPPLPATAQKAAVVLFLQVEPGTVVSVEGIKAAAAVPGVVRVWFAVTVGDCVREVRSSTDRVGSVMACADTTDEAMAIAVQAAGLIRVEVA
jgi:biotin carboxylase